MHKPGLPAAVVVRGDPERSAAGRDAHAEPPCLENWPITLSSVATNWLARGVTVGSEAVPEPWSNFLPIFCQLRPEKAISNWLRAGPVASDAMLTNRMICRVAVSPNPIGVEPGFEIGRA